METLQFFTKKLQAVGVWTPYSEAKHPRHDGMVSAQAIASNISSSRAVVHAEAQRLGAGASLLCPRLAVGSIYLAGFV